MQSSDECDVLVVGAGPAGLAAAIAVLERAPMRVMVLEKGSDIDERSCPVFHAGSCPACSRCDVLSGVGGASGMLGGKLCFFPAGERLSSHVGCSNVDANDLVMQLFDRIGFANVEANIGNAIEGWTRRIGERTVKVYDSLPILRSNLQDLFRRLATTTKSYAGEIVTRATVHRVAHGSGPWRFAVQCAHQGKLRRILVKHALVFSSGRGTGDWLGELLKELGVPRNAGSVDIGVRIEVRKEEVQDILASHDDPKIKLAEGSAEEVRTLCWCRGGEMSVTNIGGRCLVDGHFGDRWKPFSSVSLVCRTPVASGMSPWEYAQHLLSKQLVPHRPGHQLLATFMSGNSARRRSRPDLSPPLPYQAADVDLAAVFPTQLRNRLRALVETLDDMGGSLLESGGGRVYGPVIDNMWWKPLVDRNLMTSIEGLYLAGDVTGLGRGIVQALFGGLVAGASIVCNQSCVPEIVQSLPHRTMA